MPPWTPCMCLLGHIPAYVPFKRQSWGADPSAQHVQLTEGTKWQPEVWSRKGLGLGRSPRHVFTPPTPTPAIRDVIGGPGKHVRAKLTTWQCEHIERSPMAWGPLTGFFIQAKAVGRRVMDSADKHLCLEEGFRARWSGLGRGAWPWRE